MDNFEMTLFVIVNWMTPTTLDLIQWWNLLAELEMSTVTYNQAADLILLSRRCLAYGRRSDQKEHQLFSSFRSLTHETRIIMHSKIHILLHNSLAGWTILCTIWKQGCVEFVSLWIGSDNSLTGHMVSYTGPVYTMNHEVVLWRSKSLDWLLNSSRDNFGLH